MFDLPDALLRSVLGEWLSTAAVGRLDTAFCNHSSRSSFLQIAYAGDVVYSLKPVRLRELTDHIFEKSVRWCVARGAKVDTILCTTLFQSDESLCTSFLRTSGASVQYVTFKSTKIENDSRNTARDLTEWCRSVTVFDFKPKKALRTQNNPWQDHLVSFAKNNPNLQNLRLVNIEIHISGAG